MSRPPDPEAASQLWLARSLAEMAPVLRNLKHSAPTRPSSAITSPTASELDRAADVVERTARYIRHVWGAA
jgi:hypothetical protein